MRKRAIVLVLAAVMLSAGIGMARSADTTTPFTVGSTIPADLKLTDIHGKEHTLGEFRGKVVFIQFWSTVCPTMKISDPRTKALHEEFKDRGVVQIAINANQAELTTDGDVPYAKIREHVEQAGIPFMITVDPGNRLTDMFDAKTTPHCYVIDKDGVLRYDGALDDDPRGKKEGETTHYVRDAIVALLDGRAVPVDTTKPYG
jgi:thiol-disulfide isomerase/thioredoxin